MVYHVNADELVGERVRGHKINSKIRVHAVSHVRLSKRIFDIVFAVALIVFFSPFILFVAGAIWLSDGRNIFFVQDRIGLNGQTFRCIKFRTMCLDADEKLQQLLLTDPSAKSEWDTQQKLTDDPRITKIGRVLRKTSLDELPQLWNILCGEMSMVGPRPIVANEVRHYGVSYAEYKSVLPGLTGEWQVSGRSDTTYEERVQLDVDYVSNASLLHDLKIVLKTVWVVIACRGAQ